MICPKASLNSFFLEIIDYQKALSINNLLYKTLDLTDSNLLAGGKRKVKPVNFFRTGHLLDPIIQQIPTKNDPFPTLQKLKIKTSLQKFNIFLGIGFVLSRRISLNTT